MIFDITPNLYANLYILMPIIHYVIYSNIILVLFFVTCFWFENNFRLVLTLIAERYEKYLSLAITQPNFQCTKKQQPHVPIYIV